MIISIEVEYNIITNINSKYHGCSIFAFEICVSYGNVAIFYGQPNPYNQEITDPHSPRLIFGECEDHMTILELNHATSDLMNIRKMYNAGPKEEFSMYTRAEYSHMYHKSDKDNKMTISYHGEHTYEINNVNITHLIEEQVNDINNFTKEEKLDLALMGYYI